MCLNYQSLFESSLDLCLILRPDAPTFTIETATAEYLRQAKVKREDLVGRGLFEVFPDNPDDIDAHGLRNLKQSLIRVVETKRPDFMAVQKYDIRAPEAEGGHFEEHYWSSAIIPIMKNDEVKFILQRVVDVTAFIRSQQLKTSIQLREDVLAIVSHDLNNPLSTIEMSTELLKDSLRDHPSAERTELLKIIERSARHMKRLIGDLLNFAKIQAGTFTIEPGKVCLKKLLNEAQQSVLHNALKKRVRMRVQINSPADELICDYDRILEVLSNILGNAVKFSHPGGLVTTCVSLRKNDIHFCIKDEGRGIADSYMPHLFDRYWQAEETSRHGAGLGLAIAKGIILSHRGEIWAESKAGSGTSMHFTIPLTQETNSSSDFQILIA